MSAEETLSKVREFWRERVGTNELVAFPVLQDLNDLLFPPKEFDKLTIARCAKMAVQYATSKEPFKAHVHYCGEADYFKSLIPKDKFRIEVIPCAPGMELRVWKNPKLKQNSNT